MTDRSFDKFDAPRGLYTADDLMLYTAMEIAAQDREELTAAQQAKLPELPPELLARMDANIYKVLKKHGRKRRLRTAVRWIKYTAAGLAVASVASLTFGYVAVEATREKINSFLLENFGTHVIVHTQETDEESGNAIPTGWDGDTYPLWVPKRFTSVKAQSIDRSNILYYTCDDLSDTLAICFWPASLSPFWDAERMGIAESLIVQNVSANLYYNTDDQVYTLIFTKSDTTVQIFGAVTRTEILKIAENISF